MTAEPPPDVGQPAGGTPPTGDQSSGHQSSGAQQAGSPPQGSLAEEALKLAETLQAWISSGSAMPGAGMSTECKVCPLCQVISMVNGLRPEVLGHLAEAGTQLAAAFRAASESSEHTWAGTKRPPVQHIHVT
jgi:hypothetical protein